MFNKKIYWLPLVLRLVVYFIAISAPFFSSSIVVRYDIPGFAFWFIFIPIQIIITYNFAKGLFPEASSPRWVKFGKRISVSRNLFFPALIFALPLLFCIFPGFGALLPRAYIFTLIIFIFNILIFRVGVVALVFIEPVFIYFIFYKLLEFSRASESAWQDSSYILPVFYVLLIILYLFLSIILYGSSGNKKLSDFKKEIIIFFAIITPLLIIAAIFIPADHIVNDFIFNFRDEQVFPDGMGREDGYNGEDSQQGSLSGIPADRWGRRSRSSGPGEDRQYAVMIVSTTEPELYLAWEYFGGFHPVRGFTFLYNEFTGGEIDERNLNILKRQRLLETWRNPYFIPDEGRAEARGFFLSALHERVVAYLPVIVEPTIFSPQRYPFAYSYNAVSMISPLTLELLERIELNEFSERDIVKMARYLELPLSDRHKRVLDDFLRSAGATIPPESARGYTLDPEIFRKNIIAVMQGFSEYQYELGYDDDTSVEKIIRFLLKEFPGDCTEFSNAAAMLARRAGIPSRVVTGYLASRLLQTRQHIQALATLQGSLDIIANIPLRELMLVTTAHRHSWVQFYIPGMGWVDFESTEFAIPPTMGDMNSARIVIPIIRQQNDGAWNFVFPWRIILSILVVVVILVTTFLYLYKFFLMLFLSVRSLKPVPVSFESRYKYILHRFFLLGYPLKTKTMTPVEYGEINKETFLFTELFTELLYRNVYSSNEYDLVTKKFDEEYFRLKKLTKPKGFLQHIKNVFSLRGVFY
ncbi:MAG: transglutaminase domain-containing protein [Spirochaetaceae bacterium]|nr:transglutaminase domain-containing protein [Spirochaetaceae bacterium]